VIRLKNLILMAGTLALMALPEPIFACAACFGKNDSQMAKGMNAGIFSLLAVIVSVLVGAAVCGIYLVKRASKLSQAAQGQQPTVQSQFD